MLFKSLGIATATNTASNSEDSKPVTIRLTDSEVQLYDAVAKSMGLTRQDFLAHLIRNNFKQALTDFLIGYTQSSPSVSLCELIHSNTDSDEVKQKISWLLRSISQELMEEDEKKFTNTLRTNVSINSLLLAKAFLLKRLSQRRNKND